MTPAACTSVRGLDEGWIFIDNLLVRIHFIIVMIWWTGLASWEFEFPFPGSRTSTSPGLALRGVRDRRGGGADGDPARLRSPQVLASFLFFFFFTLVTGPRRSLSLKLSKTRVDEPQIRARLGTTAHLCKVIVPKLRAVPSCADLIQLSIVLTLGSLQSVLPTSISMERSFLTQHPIRHQLYVHIHV